MDYIITNMLSEKSSWQKITFPVEITSVLKITPEKAAQTEEGNWCPSYSMYPYFGNKPVKDGESYRGFIAVIDDSFDELTMYFVDGTFKGKDYKTVVEGSIYRVKDFGNMFDYIYEEEEKLTDLIKDAFKRGTVYIHTDDEEVIKQINRKNKKFKTYKVYKGLYSGKSYHRREGYYLFEEVGKEKDPRSRILREFYVK